MPMPSIQDTNLAEAVAKVHYDSYEWSGCNGSGWESLPAGAQRQLIREAAEWVACVSAASLATDSPSDETVEEP